ncbi:hypothetical protein GCM10009091_19820 [Pseudomonas brenneri]|uniref:DUF3077 domain-containing protein n=1 Tax=Pseudomonas brenneri TaxID=129817 RepID=A0A5B2V032_9PSED|nr:hypothetical protein [Pseudomonas brenneri]KAA2231665.1 hypothetical protein F1720_06230 [Pseudomonas brenneri]TWR79291.1 hypothetical protein FJD34_09985 [Pseudomonas brenneri]GGL37966.1 hypothetical protein GCM10009091_19820 [Pseudomonas brenneri]SDU89851.1 hypothetical protein SAMN04490181_1210 [Pseudomonas brenneri]
MIKHSPNPPPSYDASRLRDAAYRAINHYLQPASPAPTAAPSDPVLAGLFSVRTDLDAETLLVNAAQDLASINVLATHLAFEVDGTSRSMALGICRMLDGVQMLVDKALDSCAQPAL